MEVEYYSTIKKQYYKSTNQFIVDMSGSGKCAHNLDYHHDDDKHWATCDCSFATDEEGHSYDDGVVTTEPTVEQEGVKTYTCVCGDQKTEVIPKLDPIPEPDPEPVPQTNWRNLMYVTGGLVAFGAIVSFFVFRKKKHD